MADDLTHQLTSFRFACHVRAGPIRDKEQLCGLRFGNCIEDSSGSVGPAEDEQRYWRFKSLSLHESVIVSCGHFGACYSIRKLEFLPRWHRDGANEQVAKINDSSA
jgi:hypothetical protein